jgi:proton-dependent oligopeptide transporter, POT family
MSACKVFLWFPVFWLCYSQIDGNYGTMAAAMTLNGTPNDLIQNLNPISIIVLIPVFDYVIYPFLRRRGINFSPIKRIATGFVVIGLAMVYAGILQHYLYALSPCHDNHPSDCSGADGYALAVPINVWVISGPYILVGIGEIFASITSLEYAFTKAPKRMKSVVMAFSQFQTAVASALNFALVPANREDRFGWLFGSFAIAAWVVGALFMWT